MILGCNACRQRADGRQCPRCRNADIRYIRCSICKKPLRLRKDEHKEYHQDCHNKIPKPREICRVCEKPLLIYKNSDPNNRAHVKCLRKEYRPKGLDQPTPSQEDCIARGGKCWAFDGHPPCLHGLLMEHTDCKLNRSRIVADEIGCVPRPPRGWTAGWKRVTDLSEQEEDIDDVAWQSKRDLTVGEHLKIGELRRERNAIIGQLRDSARIGEDSGD